jgi:hypothetical protein
MASEFLIESGSSAGESRGREVWTCQSSEIAGSSFMSKPDGRCTLDRIVNEWPRAQKKNLSRKLSFLCESDTVRKAGRR